MDYFVIRNVQLDGQVKILRIIVNIMQFTVQLELIQVNPFQFVELVLHPMEVCAINYQMIHGKLHHLVSSVKNAQLMSKVKIFLIVEQLVGMTGELVLFQHILVLWARYHEHWIVTKIHLLDMIGQLQVVC